METASAATSDTASGTATKGGRPLPLWPAWLLAAAATVAAVALASLFPLIGTDTLCRYAPMAEAFAAGEWNEAFHPRFCVGMPTVAGLAQKMGVPAKALEEAVKAYNHGCDEGHDGQFFKNPAYMRKLNTNKLYAIRLGAYHFSAFGGINTNRRHQVLSTENKPIPGLSAVGCEVSDITGPTYTTWSSGLGFGFAGYSGRHAALNAVEDIK